MEQIIQDAIETIDSARQHKCELEGRRNQLNSAISQVCSTANFTRHEVHQYFKDMQQKLANDIKLRVKSLLEEIDLIEAEALDPLRDCRIVVEEGIEEASAVITSGENILNHDIDVEPSLSKVQKFIEMTNNLALDSVPEVPSATEVPSISVVFSSELTRSLSKAVQSEGKVCRRSPVQITELQAIPGGIIVSWVETEDGMDKENVNYLYKLQSYHGKLSIATSKNKSVNERNLFKDEYIGPNMMHAVKNLYSNTVYTFRVCRCVYTENSDIPKQWSPWGIYQEKMTTMPGFMWAAPKDKESYILTEKDKVATKKSSLAKVLYFEISSYLVGYPITFKIESEGKTKGKCDCIAICTKRDQDATGIHTKEGTVCMMADGHIWVNGTCTQTRFSKLCRGMIVSFQLDVSHEKSIETKKSKVPTYRATLTIGQHEAVFNWNPCKSASSFSNENLTIALFFQASGWRISII